MVLLTDIHSGEMYILGWCVFKKDVHPRTEGPPPREVTHLVQASVLEMDPAYRGGNLKKVLISQKFET